ncbi:MAG: pyruvate kinase alpha/beta domain-containing protein, partial [Armatimonadota bacterium]|nr:pyruvate kinase alpha/beta domain-containing protein [Armatimonadota bacterium]
TARAVSKYRPTAPIIAAATSTATYRQLALSWGVYPVLVKPSRSTDEMISEAVDGVMRAGLVKPNDTIVLTAGVPAGVPGRTNLIKVHTVGQPITT